MSDLRKAAELVIEAHDNCYGDIAHDAAIDQLRQALAQPEQEPFIYVREDNEKPFGGYEHCSEADAGAFPVYTAPPISDYHEGWEEGFKAAKREWVGLTVDEARKFYEKYTNREELIYAIDEFLEEKNA